MSHLQTSSVLITDIELLEKIVATHPELIWNHGTKKFNWYSSNVGDCDHMISYQKKADTRGHQVGVVRSKDGEGWQLQYDPYDSHLAGIIGHQAETLLNEYSEAYARKFAEANGFTVEKSFDDKGNIVLELVDTK